MGRGRMGSLATLLALFALLIPAHTSAPLAPGTVSIDRVQRNDDPPPAPAACPDVPASPDPIEVCPLEPSAYDADGNPLHCNYDSGNPSDPCPHADADWWIARCENGEIIHVSRDQSDGEDNAEVGCGGPYTVVDR